MGLFSKLTEGLKKTRDSFTGRINALFTKIDDDFFDNLEEILITADLGMNCAEEICAALKKSVKEKALTDPDDIKADLRRILTEMLGAQTPLDLSGTPAVICVIGVNGAGKTTTIGKLAAKLKGEGKSVTLAAADTFRAAAVEQLEIWAKRADVPIIKGKEGADPASVVFKAIGESTSDVIIIDTAGRLHNKKGLMEELRKISRIIKEQSGDRASVETLLVLDATTGQNAVNQAKLFSEVSDVTGIVLTKLDGTAKGGIIIPIVADLKIPVKLIGLGEKADDLKEFEPEAFAEALFDNEVTDDDNNGGNQ
ncbi:MAG: signal recognition particle-docking protein FtsY [Ruminococcus sp.]|jgi:fused signal recognition particle receptor|nr:signal recognition particle-docking protein FtsY [Ruminococcus sp.]